MRRGHRSALLAAVHCHPVEQCFSGWDELISEHPPSATDGDDRLRTKCPTHSYQNAVAAPLIQFCKPGVTSKFAASNNAIAVGEQYSQHSPLL